MADVFLLRKLSVFVRFVAVASKGDSARSTESCTVNSPGSLKKEMLNA